MKRTSDAPADAGLERWKTSKQWQTEIDYESAAILNTLRETVCKTATDAQFSLFLEVCKATKLNPFLKEIWFVPAVGVMAGRDGYLRVANNHPMFDGMTTLVDRDSQGIPIKATCTVWRKDRDHPIVCEAYYNEYRKGSQVWQTYKSAMISKVAEVLALKRSFSINGVVTEEEIGQPERGSRAAQLEVQERKLAQYSPGAEVVTELADSLDEKIDGDQKATAPTPKRKRGTVSFDALKHFGTIKKQMTEVTGSEDLYYEVLTANGFAHADEISDTKRAREIYRLMGVHLGEWRIEHSDDGGGYGKQLDDLEASLGSSEFWRIAGALGFDRDALEQMEPVARVELALLIKQQVEG